MIDKRVIVAIVVLLLLLVGAYQFVLAPYIDQQETIKFNEGLKNASNLEKSTESLNISDSDEDYIENMRNLVNNYDSNLKPLINEEMDVLNYSYNHTNGNETKEKYVKLQLKRVNLEKKVMDNIVDDLNDMIQASEENNYIKMLGDLSKFQDDYNQGVDELKLIQDDTLTLLSQHPDLNKTLHEMGLEYEFYGEMNVTNVDFLSELDYGATTTSYNPPVHASTSDEVNETEEEYYESGEYVPTNYHEEDYYENDYSDSQYQ